MSSTPTPYCPAPVSPSGPPTAPPPHTSNCTGPTLLSAHRPLDLVRYCRAGYRTVFACLRPHSASRPFDLHHIRLGHVTEQLVSSESSVLGRDTDVTVISFIPYWSVYMGQAR
ncbi:hypothetical protein DFP72DRAFT_1076153 [Ephemerocybe angulata]|uniref:Uncharacterized protein n=1 Tax=Ephemerocybe angulata TaxID=980116 RepID=A0A8H6LYE3_9AGAR|nr:hypothetical protein DFP72DRAFT_1076153 [Tulosesus angulatus]